MIIFRDFNWFVILFKLKFSFFFQFYRKYISLPPNEAESFALFSSRSHLPRMGDRAFSIYIDRHVLSLDTLKLKVFFWHVYSTFLFQIILSEG